MSSDRDFMPPSNEVVSLINYSKAMNASLLLGCDANARHALWGSTNCNAKKELHFLTTF